MILDRIEARDIADDLDVVAHVPLGANAAAFFFIGIKDVGVDPVRDEHHFFARQSAFGSVFQTRPSS